MTYDRNGDGRAYCFSLSSGVCVSLILNMQNPFTCVYYTSHTFTWNTIQERKYMNAHHLRHRNVISFPESAYLQLVRLCNDIISTHYSYNVYVDIYSKTIHIVHALLFCNRAGSSKMMN